MKDMEELISDLIDAAEWKGANEQVGYMAGDKKAEEDQKEVDDAANAIRNYVNNL